MDKLIVTVAGVGAEVTRAVQPNLPISPEEIALDVFACRQAGAAVAHLHARNQDGSPTQNFGVYQQIISEIQRRCDIVIQVSTGGAVGMSVSERVAPLRLQPEMATLTTGTVNFGEDVFLNQPSDIREIAKTLREHGIKPEIEIFDSGMVASAMSLVKQGLLEMPLHFDFVMGVLGGIPGTPRALLWLIDLLPKGATWTVAGIGAAELPLATMAIILGGHVRVGFEDNIYYATGRLAESNAQLVERIVRISRELGREIADPSEARQILGLKR